MNKLTQKFLVVSVLALAGCDRETNHGRLVGFVVDGQSGQRLNFFKADGDKQNVDDDKDSQSQVYAVIDGEFRRAKPCGSGDLTEKNAIEADGCFQLEDIPEGMTIPIFAQAPNYERFVGEYTYEELDDDIEHSQRVANIRLFPKGFSVDYRFNVSYGNQPVAKTQVFCQYLAVNDNSLQVDGEFLTPKNTSTTTVSATTGDDGVAVIPGAQLVNGASYHCEAVLSQPLDGRTLAGQANIVAGVSQGDQLIALSASGTTDPTLYAVRSNIDDPNVLVGANGKLIITFNRPVEIVPGTANCQTATASAPDTDNDRAPAGTLVTDDPTNAVSEQVTVDVSGDGLTMSIGFRAATTFDTDDRGTTVSLNGIVVRPRATADARQARYIGALGACPAATAYGVENTLTLKNQRLSTPGNTATQPGVLKLF
ncbi:hypothetical protein JRI60_10395 [Archangium violaceum]|uniref:hypothetical protein n=1 Tax=Archangium violaceum TaxID=83451 RepID=UPI00194FB36A|nr:hypothetical protein [Archangium violaceum]QRN99392.1 hypothetical protein JRI60_10395 [Archangium violaceum]